jgi:hypothetical protein
MYLLIHPPHLSPTLAFGKYRGEVQTLFWWGNFREAHHLGDVGIEGREILKQTFKKMWWEGMK